MSWGSSSLPFPPEVKRQEQEADRSLSISATFKNGGAVTPLLHVFMAQSLTN
jgi:hypothetical protein